MKKYIITLFCGAVLFAQCGKTIGVEKEGEYVSHFYYSYKAEKVFSNFGNTLDFDAAFPIAQTNDRIFVASRNSSNVAQVVVLDKESGKQLATIVCKNDVGASGTILNIAVGKDRLYVSAMEAWVHVYDLNTYKYLCSFGDGNYNRSIQAMAMIEWGDFLLMREKRSAISILRLKDLTKENMPILNGKRAYTTAAVGDCSLYAGMGYKVPTNTWDNGSSMVMASDSTIYMPDKQSKFIACLSTKKIASLPNNGSGSLVVPEETIPTPSYLRPVSVAVTPELLFATGNAAICVYDRINKKWLDKNIKSVAGYDFANAYRILSEGEDYLWVVDIQKKAIVKVHIKKNEVREY